MSSKWNIKTDINNDHKLNPNTTNHNLFKKAFITTVLLSSVTFNLAFANENDSNDSNDSNDNTSFEKIYHIYVGDKYIGVVTSKEDVSEVILAKELEVKKIYKDYKLDGKSNITIIPEQVFSYDTVDNYTTLEKLKQDMVIEAEAFAIKINGQDIVYLKDQADYEKTLRLLKLQYVTEKQLNKFEESTSQKTLPALKENEKRIKEINFIENISSSEVEVDPKEILTPEKAVEYLKSGSLEKEIYTVQKGDVLSTIADKHNLKTSDLMNLNPGLTEDTILNIGQEINVTISKPLVNVQVIFEKQKVEKIPFDTVKKKDSSMFKGETVVTQEGSEGEKEVSYVVTQMNGKEVNKEITEEEIITEPTDRITVVGTKVVSSLGTGRFIWPTSGGYISSQMGSRWGSFHKGIDIAQPSNYNIKASDNGVVTFTGWDGSYGNKVTISHNNGYETVYAHLSEINVNVGQVVSQSSIIGIMGSTGNSTGTHLHFEIYKNGAVQNPLSYLN